MRDRARTAPDPGRVPPRGAALAVSLLVAATVAYAFLWPRAAWLAVSAADRPAVERALGEAAAIFRTTPEAYRWTTRPTVSRSPGRLCVGLESWRSGVHGHSGYWACYDKRSGEIVEQRASL